MAFRTTLGLIIALVSSQSLCADEVRINPDHPEQYVVARGDTLWDISGRFLQNPSQWPKIWHVNPQINNPHLIFPGDVIAFSVIDGQPRLSLNRTGTDVNSSWQDQVGGSREVKLYPRIRESDIKEAIELIPSDKIAQFLTSPRIVGPKELEKAPYVLDFAGEHLVAGAGDRVYVRSLIEPDSLAYTIYRSGDTFISPDTGEILGYEAKFIANTTLQAAGDPATLYITNAKGEIRIGDRVMPHQDGEFTLHYFPNPPDAEINGSIISVLDGVSQIGRFNVVAIDKGEIDGLKVGHVLDIHKRGEIVRDPYSPIKNDAVKLPDEIAGSLMVFRTFERLSYALVMEANQALHVLDRVQTP